MKQTGTVLILSFLLISLGAFNRADIPVFTGKWDMNCETHTMELYLIQNGSRVVGTYDVPLGSGNMGYVIGDLVGNRLNFEYAEVFYGDSKLTSSGRGHLEISTDGKSIAGELSGFYDSGEKDEAKWTGTRMEQ